MSEPAFSVGNIAFGPELTSIDLLIDDTQHTLAIMPLLPDRWRAEIYDSALNSLCRGEIATPPSASEDGPAFTVEWRWLSEGDAPAWFGYLGTAAAVTDTLAAVIAPSDGVIAVGRVKMLGNQYGDEIKLRFRLGDREYLIQLDATHGTRATRWSLTLHPILKQVLPTGVEFAGPALCRGRIACEPRRGGNAADLDANTIVVAIMVWLAPREPVAEPAEVRRNPEGTAWLATVSALGIREERTWQLEIALDLEDDVYISPPARRWLAERLGPDAAARIALAAADYERGLRGLS